MPDSARHRTNRLLLFPSVALAAGFPPVVDPAGLDPAEEDAFFGSRLSHSSAMDVWWCAEVGRISKRYLEPSGARDAVQVVPSRGKVISSFCFSFSFSFSFSLPCSDEGGCLDLLLFLFLLFLWFWLGVGPRWSTLTITSGSVLATAGASVASGSFFLFFGLGLVDRERESERLSFDRPADLRFAWVLLLDWKDSPENPSFCAR